MLVGNLQRLDGENEMSRDIPYDPEAVCEVCGAKGAYDFMGDLLCGECITTGLKIQSKNYMLTKLVTAPASV
jgi:hypothetical protein